MAKVLNYKVIVEQDEDGVFVAQVPSIPGCHTQGDSYEEVIENIQEAIKLCLEVANENKNYAKTLSIPEKTSKSRFLGIIDVPIKFEFS